MNACKYTVGQKVQIAAWEGETPENRVMVVRDATVVKTVSRLHGNMSWIFLSVAHADCFEDMRVSTRTLTTLVKLADGFLPRK
jgi:hypothetical protein